MKIYLHHLFTFVVILLPVEIWGQNEVTTQYWAHKNLLEELSQQKQSFGRDTLMVQALDSMIFFSPMLKISKYDDIFSQYKNLVDENKWMKGISKYKMFYGSQLMGDLNRPVEGIKYLIEAEKEFKISKDYKLQIFTLLRLSTALTYHTDSLSALPFIDKALSISRKIKSQYWINQSLTYKGDYYMNRKQFKQAIPIFQEISKQKGLDKKTFFCNNLNLGMSFININNSENGMVLVSKTLKEMPKDISYYAYLHKAVREDLVKIFIQKGYFQKANQYLFEIEPFMAKEQKDKNDQMKFNLYAYQINKGLGNFKEALYFLESRKIYEDTLHSYDIKNRIEGIKTQLAFKEQYEKLQKSENEKLKIENERQNQLRWLLIGLSIIGLFSTIYVFRTNKKLKNSNQQLLEKNKEISEAMLKGQTTERKRVASDLHDNLGSTMSSIRWAFQAIDRTKWSDNEKEIFSNVQTMFDKAYDDIRLLSHNLLPEEFERLGLTTILQNFIRKINKNTTIRFDLKVDGEFGRVDKKIEFELYSICLELVNNIMKHSKASEAVIELSRTNKQIKLMVSDNGIGIFKNDSDGKGMKNVQARVESLNGIWNIQNSENEGVVNEILISV